MQNNFDLNKFLIENKLTSLSLEEDNLEEMAKFVNPSDEQKQELQRRIDNRIYTGKNQEVAQALIDADGPINKAMIQAVNNSTTVSSHQAAFKKVIQDLNLDTVNQAGVTNTNRQRNNQPANNGGRRGRPRRNPEQDNDNGGNNNQDNNYASGTPEMAEALFVIFSYYYFKENGNIKNNSVELFTDFLLNHPPNNNKVSPAFTENIEILGTTIPTSVLVEWGKAVNLLQGLFRTEGGELLYSENTPENRQAIINIINNSDLSKEINTIASNIKNTTLIKKVEKLADEYAETLSENINPNFKLYIFSTGSRSKGDTKADFAVKFSEKTYDLNDDDDVTNLFNTLNGQDSSSYGASVKKDASFLQNMAMTGTGTSASRKILKLASVVPGFENILDKLEEKTREWVNKYEEKYQTKTVTNAVKAQPTELLKKKARDDGRKLVVNQMPYIDYMLKMIDEYFTKNISKEKMNHLLRYFSDISFGVGDDFLKIKDGTFKLGTREMVNWFIDNGVNVGIDRERGGSDTNKNRVPTRILKFYITHNGNKYELFELFPEIHSAGGDNTITINGRIKPGNNVENWVDAYRDMKKNLDMEEPLRVRQQAEEK